MGNALKRTATTTSHEYVLDSPTNAAEVTKAMNWAHRELMAAQGVSTAEWDDAITITCLEDQLVISWAEKMP